ncbi:MAG: DedA family protein [bacterium]|nr:DedA family protein [bacterium]
MEFLVHWITDFISQVSYTGIFILMLLESALIPIPSEVTMLFSGFLASTGRFNFWLVVLAGAVGNLVGSWLAYWLGLWGESSVVRGLIRRFGKYVLISEEEFNRAEIWFNRYGEVIVFFSRILPVVRTFISLPAGIAKMNFWKFTIYTFIGSLIWSYFLTKIGFTLGANWAVLENYFRQFQYLIAGFLFIGIFWYALRKIRKL